MFYRIATALALASFALFAVAAQAEERLIFGSTNPPPVPVNPKFFDPWAKRVNEQGKGVLFIDVRHDPAIANFTNYLDRTLNDVVQISWGIQSLLGPRFAKSAVIALPLIAPGLAAATIFNLAAYWSEFALALVLLDSQSRFTIPIGVFSLQSAYETEWQLVAAASFIGLVPMMAAFIVLQRYFIAGLTAGAVKG